jgi:aminopeptidase N
METYLGPDRFRAGVNSYLKQHSYANASASDFWNAETQASGKPVDKIMPTWIEQAGLPLVVVKAKCADKLEQVTLEQARYFYDQGKLNADSQELWQIPLCMKLRASDPEDGAACKLLAKKRDTFTLPGCSPWTYVNANAKGFYRSGYDSDAIQSMAHAAESTLSPAERILLVDDVWASVAVDREPIGDYMVLSEGLRTEHTGAVLEEALKNLAYIRNYIVSDADAESYDLWLRQLLGPTVEAVGWEAKPDEPEEQGNLRAQLMIALGDIARDPQVQLLAQRIASEFLDDPKSVDAGIASVALRVAARRGDEAFYDKLMTGLQGADSPEIYIEEVIALTRFSQPKFVERTLEFAISPQVRSQDAVDLIYSVMQNPDAAKPAWSFVQAHWDAIEKLGGAFAGGLIVQGASSFCEPELRDEVQTFFTAHPAPAGERSLKQSLEQISYCVDRKARQRDRLASWLHLHTSSTSN